MMFVYVLFSTRVYRSYSNCPSGRSGTRSLKLALPHSDLSPSATFVFRPPYTNNRCPDESKFLEETITSRVGSLDVLLSANSFVGTYRFEAPSAHMHSRPGKYGFHDGGTDTPGMEIGMERVSDPKAVRGGEATYDEIANIPSSGVANDAEWQLGEIVNIRILAEEVDRSALVGERAFQSGFCVGSLKAA